jgi:hypothetical protein
MTPRWTKDVAPVAEAIAEAFVSSQSESGVRIGRLPTVLTEANRSAGREVTKRTGHRLGLQRCVAGEDRLFAPQEGPRIIAAMSKNGFRVPVLLWSLPDGDNHGTPGHS